ncbi:MAG: DUF2493 domain-containing protein [Hyphomicrobiales bacterium]|nr:DUF2493 domain-containing protein [Hyphomicrobiales bacterium]
MIRTATGPNGLSRTSATGRVVEALNLYGYEPQDGEPDHRPLPEPDDLAASLETIFELLEDGFAGTKLERDIEDLLRAVADLFHRKLERVERQLGNNEDRQRECQREQDGSEVQSVKLERLLDQGQTILERRSIFEGMRDKAAELFEARTGSAWRPRAGSHISRATLTASLIDSRDFLAAEKSAKNELLVPKGTKIAVAGGPSYQDHHRIFETLDKARAKYPDLVLLHGGTPTGADHIAGLWAKNRGVTQIAFKPDWKKDGKAAPFKRNDRLLAVIPKGLIAFPGNGITDNLVDKAKQMGIRVADHRKAP